MRIITQTTHFTFTLSGRLSGQDHQLYLLYVRGGCLRRAAEQDCRRSRAREDERVLSQTLRGR